MKYVPFVHLHVNSEYSLLKSALRVSDAVRLAAEHSMSALALTDRMNLHAGISFYDECYRHGIKPLLGAEIALESISAVENVDPQRPATYDIVVIAEDNKGYENLCELLTRIHSIGNRVAPHARKEWFEELAGHWFVLSGGIAGELFRMLVHNDEVRARRTVEWLAHASGPGRFYIELQWHELPEQHTVLPRLIDLARSCNIPVAATNECRYASSDDAIAVELLRKVEEGSTADSLDSLTPATSQMYFRNYDEMAAIFKNIPEALANTVAIADQCAVELQVGTAYLTPRFTPPGEKTSRQYLEELCRDGLSARYPDWEDPGIECDHPLTKKKRKEIEKRLSFELDTIADMGFLSYFLIVHDFVNYAKIHGIPVGPGRGSAAGSLVSYLLSITEIDPLDYNLLFERFLNPARKKMPDIDIDFCERRREEVIRYVRETYGSDRVAQISTFSKLRYKAALRDIGRVLRMPEPVIDKISLFIADYERTRPHSRTGIIAQACRSYDPLRELYLSDKTAKTAIDLGLKIEDLPRNLSTHAAGVVIAPKPLRTFVPLVRISETEMQTQFDMYAVERLGLLKMDFLGLTTLTILDDALKLIAATGQEPPELSRLPLKDKATYQLLCRGDVLGIFQLETSVGMRRLVQQLQPSEFKDIIALVALFRPGPMHNREEYVERRHGRKPITYPHPRLEPILKETYGIMLYQEQIMQCLHSLLGYSLADADIFRQIMSKKDTRKIEAERTKFMLHAEKKELDNDCARDLFEDIAKFAGYGFNKSHATAYAVIAYWTAYLKTHYSAEFFAALMNSKLDTPEKFIECRQNCRSLGVDLLQPDVNKSQALFSVEVQPENGRHAIRFGLEAVRNVGPHAAAEILRQRSAGGPFSSIDDLCRRVDYRVVNRKAFDSLVKAGACDFTGQPRQRMALVVDDISASWERKGESELQRSFFDAFDEDKRDTAPARSLDTIDEWDPVTLLTHEKEILGIYLSGHPLDQFTAGWRAFCTADSRNTGYVSTGLEAEEAFVPAGNSRDMVIMGGLLLKAEWRTSRKRRTYGVLRFEDFYGTFNVLLWSEMVERYKPVIETGKIWFIRGYLKETFGRTSLTGEALAEPDEALHDWPLSLDISVPAAASRKKLTKLSQLFSTHQGAQQVDLILHSTEKKNAVVMKPDITIAISEDLLRSIEEICGEGSVKCK
jgi:DNA polymerase-3 subunit alpha